MTRLTHGYTGTRTFKSWDSMKQRCFNPNSKDYASYGGRGVTVCADWINDFPRFLSDMGERPEGCSLDRIDNNGNYEPSNCRWADAVEQQRNTRVSKRLTVGGVTKPLIEWASDVGVRYSTLLKRINAGWTPEKIVGQPSRKRPHRHEMAV